VAGLRLEVREFTDLTRWRWVLTDSSEVVVADHEVRLDPVGLEYMIRVVTCVFLWPS
jgi:hypothetical protein